MAGCYKLFRPGCICFLSQAEPAGLWPEPNLQSAGAPQGSAQSLDPDSGVPVLASSLPSCAALGHLLNLYECLFHLKKKNVAPLTSNGLKHHIKTKITLRFNSSLGLEYPGQINLSGGYRLTLTDDNSTVDSGWHSLWTHDIW